MGKMAKCSQTRNNSECFKMQGKDGWMTSFVHRGFALNSLGILEFTGLAGRGRDLSLK